MTSVSRTDGPRIPLSLTSRPQGHTHLQPRGGGTPLKPPTKQRPGLEAGPSPWGFSPGFFSSLRWSPPSFQFSWLSCLRTDDAMMRVSLGLGHTVLQGLPWGHKAWEQHLAPGMGGRGSACCLKGGSSQGHREGADSHSLGKRHLLSKELQLLPHIYRPLNIFFCVQVSHRFFYHVSVSLLICCHS